MHNNDQKQIEIRMESIGNELFVSIKKAYASLGYTECSSVFDKTEGCYVIKFSR